MDCVSETPATKNNNSFYSMLNTNKSKKFVWYIKYYIKYYSNTKKI